jgi:hypothetical protein
MTVGTDITSHRSDRHDRWYAIHRHRHRSQPSSRLKVTTADVTPSPSTALLSMLTLSSPNLKALIGISQNPQYRGVIQWNVEYWRSPIGTLGPCTICQTYYRWSTKGDRTLSRFRLEICPATASELAAGCKPHIISFALCERTYAFCTQRCSNQMRIFFISPSASQIKSLTILSLLLCLGDGFVWMIELKCCK